MVQRMLEPNSEPARCPSAVWQKLITLGGLEPVGRDKDFVELIRVELAPQASDITAALAACPDNETLVRAIFGAVAPFAAMSRDIVEFMRGAETREGKACIEIALDSSILGLEDFEKFIEAVWTAPGVVEVPDATIDDAFALANALRQNSSRRGLAADVKIWREAFDRGEFNELPASLGEAAVPPELEVPSYIAATALEALRSVAKTRNELKKHLEGSRREIGAGSMRDPLSVAIVEHDLVGPMIEALGQAVQQVDRTASVQAMGTILARIPMRPQLSMGNATVLEKVLSLPAWKRRYELYAVWIATRIAAAVDPERVTVHTDKDGALTFPFQPVRLATIESADGPKSLWAERQTHCTNPIGKGRKGNVQPDYSLWHGPVGAEQCGLIVEVKHYKTPALGTFGAALVDYANAHPHAETVLVNYGAAAGVVEHERWQHHGVLNRCHEIGELMPYNREACEAFAQMVRDAAGAEPQPDVLLLDVSGSTREKGGRMWTQSIVQSWLRAPEQAHIKRVIAADDVNIAWDLPRFDAVNRLNDHINVSGGDPINIAWELLRDMKRIWIATDGSGLRSFRDAGFLRFEHLRHMTGVEILEVGTNEPDSTLGH